jgi:hypothetical protein
VHQSLDIDTFNQRRLQRKCPYNWWNQYFRHQPQFVDSRCFCQLVVALLGHHTRCNHFKQPKYPYHTDLQRHQATNWDHTHLHVELKRTYFDSDKNSSCSWGPPIQYELSSG